MGQHLVVMVVEDDSDIAAFFKIALEEFCGVHCVVAADGAKALELVGVVKIALMLLDINIPPPNGLEVLRQLRANPSTRSLPIICVSAHDERRRAEQLGCHAYLGKPVDLDVLIRKVNEYLLPQVKNGVT